MAQTSPTDPMGSQPYKQQYSVTPEMREFWQHLFPNADLTAKQISEMNDQFIKTVWNQMNTILQWALKQQKERHREEKEQEQ